METADQIRSLTIIVLANWVMIFICLAIINDTINKILKIVGEIRKCLGLKETR